MQLFHVVKESIFSAIYALFTSTPHVFLLNIFINTTERSIHFYWIHFLNKIVTWLTREYVYLWYRLLEINSSDEWWGNMQIIHTLIRDSSYFYQMY
jgi:hypothetical protein